MRGVAERRQRTGAPECSLPAMNSRRATSSHPAPRPSRPMYQDPTCARFAPCVMIRKCRPAWPVPKRSRHCGQPLVSRKVTSVSLKHVDLVDRSPRCDMIPLRAHREDRAAYVAERHAPAVHHIVAFGERVVENSSRRYWLCIAWGSLVPSAFHAIRSFIARPHPSDSHGRAATR